MTISSGKIQPEGGSPLGWFTLHRTKHDTWYFSDRKTQSGRANGTTGSACVSTLSRGRAKGTTGEVAPGGCVSGGGFEGDAVAQRGELADVVADLAGSVDAGGVVVGSQVVEACGRVG